MLTDEPFLDLAATVDEESTMRLGRISGAA